jgi:hypothetical protein
MNTFTLEFLSESFFFLVVRFHSSAVTSSLISRRHFHRRNNISDSLQCVTIFISLYLLLYLHIHTVFIVQYHVEENKNVYMRKIPCHISIQ